MISPIRAFFAFDLREDDKKLIKKIFNRNFKTLNYIFYQKNKGNLKLVAEKNFHITFLFIARLNSELFNKLKNDFYNKIQFEPFEVKINKIEAFTNNKGQSRVLFLDIKSDTLENQIKKYKELIYPLIDEELKNQLDNIHPHITLARFKKPVSYEKLKQDIEILNEKFRDVTIKISDFALFRSILNPQGPTYKKLWSKSK